MLGKLIHRIQHWLNLEPCMNHSEWRGNELWHYVACIKCGERVLEFKSDIKK